MTELNEYLLIEQVADLTAANQELTFAFNLAGETCRKLEAERDELRAEVARLENSVDTLLAFVNGKITRAELDNQINSTTTGEQGQ